MEASLKHKSLVDIPEGELVERLMGEHHWRERVIGLHGISSDVEVYLEVPLNELLGEPKGEPLGAGTSGASLKRLAIPVTQPSEVTEWVQRTIDEKRA